MKFETLEEQALQRAREINGHLNSHHECVECKVLAKHLFKFAKEDNEIVEFLSEVNSNTDGYDIAFRAYDRKSMKWMVWGLAHDASVGLGATLREAYRDFKSK